MKRNQEFYTKLGYALRSQRKIKQVPLEIIIKELEITHQQIQKYETGENRIPLDNFLKYCEILEIKPEWISK